jgi:hypothetical protein
MRFVRIVPALVVLLAAVSCASPETDDTDATPAATAGEADGANVLRVTQREYEFAVTGEPRAGTLTVDVSNEGKEWHELVMAKLKEGKTLTDVREALQNAGEDEDPFGEFADEDATGKIDDLGGSQFPGTSYAITGSGIAPGDYALICFVPDDDGKAHWSLGMLSEFTIAPGSAGDAPPPDVTYTAGAEGLDGPTEVDSGETEIRVANESGATRELGLLRVKDGKTMADVAASLEAADEGPPTPATAPFDYFAYIFDAEQTRTITVDLTPGTWAIQAADPEDESSPPPDEDPNAVVFTVS